MSPLFRRSSKVKPTKDNKDNKIDAVIAILEALGGWLIDGNGDVEIV